MTKKKKDSQGEIIDEVRKARKAVWLEFKADEKKFFQKTRELAKVYGMHYATPPKRRKRSEGEDAA
jgi:hypothetical protein